MATPDQLKWLRDCIQTYTAGFENVLELGCGKEAPYEKLFLHQSYIGIDAWDVPENNPSINHWFQRCEILEYLIALPKRYPNTVVLMIDVLEHFRRQDALYILDRCQELFPRIVAFVPVGNHPQGPGSDGNPWQGHLSTWEYEDLEIFFDSVTRCDTFHKSEGEGKDPRAAFCLWNKPIIPPCPKKNSSGQFVS